MKFLVRRPFTTNILNFNLYILFQIIFVASLALVSCVPVPDTEPFVHVHQDTAGNYKATFDAGDIFKTEEGINGEVVGSYSYIDGDGIKQTIKYTAGVGGFVASGTNLPVREPENPEVVKARNEHIATYNEVLKTVPITEEFNQVENIVPQETIVYRSGSSSGLVPRIKYVPYEIAV